jgi:hypothetical protein
MEKTIAVGRIIMHDGKFLKVKELDTCIGCYFATASDYSNCTRELADVGECFNVFRLDNTSVIFEECGVIDWGDDL